MNNGFENQFAELEQLIGSLALSQAQRAELMDKINELILIDPLTRVLNRRGLDKKLEEETRRSKRYGHTLSIIMADIDFFKMYNDMYGHLQGDEALRHASKILSPKRGGEAVGRYGGEEFLIVLPEMGGEAATSYADEIRNKFKSTPLTKYVGAEASRGGNYREGYTFQNLTISMGVATAIKNHDIGDMIKAADASLYRAKKFGRDRVYSSHQEELVSPIP